MYACVSLQLRHCLQLFVYQHAAVMCWMTNELHKYSCIFHMVTKLPSIVTFLFSQCSFTGTWDGTFMNAELMWKLQRTVFLERVG